MKQIKWGIIGLGNIAHLFTKDLLLLQHTSIEAVASRSQEKANAFAKQYHIPKAYGNYKDILQNSDIDIIYIATPHNSHEALSVAALEAGKHVLCEKPLAVNHHQVNRMIAAAKKHQRFLMEAFWSKFNPSIKACLEIAKSGTIGEINYLNAEFSFYREDPPDSRMLNMALAGGSLLDMGVYPLFLAYELFGMPTQVLATSHFHDTGADMQTSAILKYDNGIANLYSGFASQVDMVAKIYGTKGRIYIEPYWHETQGFIVIEGNDGKTRRRIVEYPTNGKGFTYEIEECIRCIQNNELESPHWTHQNSLDLIAIADTVRKEAGLKYPFE